MGVKIKGLNHLLASLANTAERSSRGSREALEKGAEDIKDLARLYAPVDQKNLEKSIKTGKFKDSTNHGRNTYTVFVDEDMSAGPNKKVGDYADEMHELHGIDYQPGDKTIAKQNANPGVYVGRKFLERALDDKRDEIGRKVEEKLKQGIGH
ncbi:MAG: HK97 gp10 family phage protein [Candidatus Binatia bacterium]